MRDYYTEFLEKKSENVSICEVSKVSKVSLRLKNIPFDTFDTEQTHINPQKKLSHTANDSFFAKRGVMQSFCPAESISQTLDAMIEQGAWFDVAENDFHVLKAEHLTDAQKDYLAANEAPVLCTLHQRFLMKYLFYDSAELLKDFAFEIYEREAVLAEDIGLYTYENYFAAVSETSRKWFAQLLDIVTEENN